MKRTVLTQLKEKLEKGDKEKRKQQKYMSDIRHTERKNEDVLRSREVGNMAARRGHRIYGKCKHP